MNFFLRLMGWVAKASNELSRQSVNMLPMNWLVMIIGGIFGFGGWSMLLLEGKPNGALMAIPGTAVSLAFLVSFLKRDTFFVAEPLPTAPSISSDGPLDAPLRWTGRLRLHEKAARRFIDMPATGTRLADGTFAIASRIDASTRFYGVVTNSKTGVWLALPTPSTFEIEAGTLYYGFRGSPSLRLNFVDGTDKKKAKAIISCDTPEARAALYAWLEAEKTKTGGPGSPVAARISAPTPSSDSPFSSSTHRP